MSIDRRGPWWLFCHDLERIQERFGQLGSPRFPVRFLAELARSQPPFGEAKWVAPRVKEVPGGRLCCPRTPRNESGCG